MGESGTSAKLPLDLSRPRDLGDILSTCLALYMSYFGLFASLAFGVVAPIDVWILGFGEGMLWSGYVTDTSIAALVVEGLAPLLVTTPLVTATHVYAVRAMGEGRVPSLSEVSGAGFRVIIPVAAVVVLYTFGTLAGLIALLIPGIYLAVRWCVAVPAAVVDGARGSNALGRSAELVEGSWWRVFGILVVLVIIASVASSALLFPLDLLADDLDSGPVQLVGRVLSDTVVYSFTALSSTILYFDLRARKETEAPSPTAVTG